MNLSYQRSDRISVSTKQLSFRIICKTGLKARLQGRRRCFSRRDRSDGKINVENTAILRA